MAVGCIGMSFDDFCALTPGEFTAAHKAWIHHEEEVEKSALRRMRLHACLTLQPHLKPGSRAVPEKILPFPFDREEEKEKKPAPKSTLERFKELAEKYSHEQ